MRTLIRFVTSMVLLSTAVPAFAFTDVVSSTSYGPAISALEEKGTIDGYSDGTFKPMANINRAEFLKIVLEAKGDAVKGSTCFPDVRTEWFAPYVCSAKDAGIISGYPDGNFKPEQPINVVEASKIMTLAFGVTIQNDGGDWYAPYMRALEYSKAIPLSITGLDTSIKRGEMAEILWRLTEDKTTQPSKSYMNVKYPELSVNLASSNVQYASSCEDVRTFMNEAQATNGGGILYYDKGIMAPTAMPSTPSMRGGTATESDGAAVDHSDTNVQVVGVDEADTVKTDGKFVYTLKGQSVRIVQVQTVSALKEVATIDLAKDNMQPTELYLDSNRLVVIGQVYESSPYPYPVPMNGIAPNVKMMPIMYRPSRTEVRIYDVTSPANPKLQRTVDFDGSALSSRRIGDKVYLVLNQSLWMYPYATNTSTNVLPMYKDSAKGTSDMPVTDCSKIAILPRVPSPQYLIVGAIPLQNATAPIGREVVLGNAGNIYSSLKNLYISAPEWSYIWNGRGGISDSKTNIYRFAFTSTGVALKAQGSVPGTILNQFSMDEQDDMFRVATNSGNMWDSAAPAVNNLYILNAALTQVGAVEKMAPGEQIRSVRFMGDRAYVVTFKNTDPLFVIDVADARHPKILGKLKVPGYSDYLHPYDATHLIGFGKDAVDAKQEGFAWYQGMKVAMFDVSDVANPKELFNTVIGDRGTDSPLLTNHKAILFDVSRNLLAFPINVSEIPAEQKVGNDGSAYGSPVFQGAYVYSINLKGMDLKGTITHYDADAFTKAGDYWYDDGHNIERILRIDNSLVTVSQSEIMTNDLSSLKQQGSVTLQELSTK